MASTGLAGADESYARIQTQKASPIGQLLHSPFCARITPFVEKGGRR